MASFSNSTMTHNVNRPLYKGEENRLIESSRKRLKPVELCDFVECLRKVHKAFSKNSRTFYEFVFITRHNASFMI